jgi:hypothetical protein
MAAGSFVVAALAVAGAAAGSLSGTGAPPTPAASVVSCATEGSSTTAADVVAGTRRATSPAADRGETSDESDTLASRARERSGGGAGSSDADEDTGGATADSGQSAGARGRGTGTGTAEASADELAQALADALAGSTNPAAQRIAEALADEGFVATEQRGVPEQDETGQDETGTGAGAGRGNDTGTGRSNNGSDRTGNGLADDGGDSDAAQSSNRSGRTGNGLADDEATCADSGEETGRASNAGTGRSTREPEQESGRGGAARDDADGSAGRTGSQGRANDDRSSDGIASVLDRTADTAAERGDGLR